MMVDMRQIEKPLSGSTRNSKELSVPFAGLTTLGLQANEKSAGIRGGIKWTIH